MAREKNEAAESGAHSRRRRLAPDPRVLVGLGSLVALLAGAVGVAVFLIAALESDTRELSDRPFQYATAIHEASLEAKALANHERGFFISGGDEEYTRQLEEGTADVRAAFRAAVTHAATSAERRGAALASDGFEQWLASSQRDIEAYRAGRRKEAIESSLTTTRQLRKDYERALTDAHALGLRTIERARSSLSDSAARSVTILLVYLALALVAGVGVAIWVARMLLRPAHALTEHALEVLTKARLVVAEDARGSHHAVAVEVPVEVVNTLAESALETREALRPAGRPAKSFRSEG